MDWYLSSVVRLHAIRAMNTKAIIEQNGGKNTGSISGKTDYLLAGANMGPAKLAKAEKMGIKIINEEEFLNILVE